jgi:hypothetical protein
LQSATDPQGIVSLYGYDNTNFLNTLTTPYGTTTFNTDSDINHQAVQATNPLGQTERAELRYNSISAIADSEASTPSVSGMLLTNSGLRRLMTRRSAPVCSTAVARRQAWGAIVRWA